MKVKSEENVDKEQSNGHGRRMLTRFSNFWRLLFARIGEDWIFLALLGVIMAILSLLVDIAVNWLSNERNWLYRDLSNDPFIQYIAWVTPPVILILFSVGFVNLVAPQAAGSGIAEMKTILRGVGGVSLKKYLTFKTLVAKCVGVIATLGAAMPLGKEGPFVHIGGIIGTLLSKLIRSFNGVFENECRNTDMLAAACGIGLGACFSAPVGGVLFSIEATSTYFAVRNYWRGFFGAICGATLFRLLVVWFQSSETVTALFFTNFTMEFPFDPQELFVFALIGVACGLSGALFVWLHRQYVYFMRSNKLLKYILQKNRFLYPGMLTLFIATITYPKGLGKFLGGEISTHEQFLELFSNFTWSQDNLTLEQEHIVSHWSNPHSDGVLLNLLCYLLYNFFFTFIAYTMPIPAGIFIPSFKIGAALGRIFGEVMHLIFPLGVRYGNVISPIMAGGYSMVGAAAFTGSVTHTLSVGVLIFEMTGQICHLIPVMIAVVLSNAVAIALQPSIYDSIILIKKLPYMPDLLPSRRGVYNVFVEDFMNCDIKFIYDKISYQTLREILTKNKKLKSLPLVDSPENMILLGSVPRHELIKLIDKHASRVQRLKNAAEMLKEAEERDQEEKMQQMKISKIMDKRNITNKGMATPQPNKLSSPEFGMKRSATLGDLETAQSDEKQLDQKKSHFTCTPTNLPQHIRDLATEDLKVWEQNAMTKPVDLEGTNVHIDASPFQLVKRTSILKVHSLFAMVGINHAYVTERGRLVGVVSIKELRRATEDVNNGRVVLNPQAPFYVSVTEPLLLGGTKEGNKSNGASDNNSFLRMSSENDSIDIELDNIKNTMKME